MTQGHHPTSVLTFRVGPFNLCVEVGEVTSVIQRPATRSLPIASPSLIGVFCHRGSVVPLVSLRRKLSLPDGRHNDRELVILSSVDGHPVGFLVDAADRLVSADTIHWQPVPPSISSTVVGRCGIDGPRILSLCRLKRLLDLPESTGPVEADSRAAFEPCQPMPGPIDEPVAPGPEVNWKKEGEARFDPPIPTRVKIGGSNQHRIRPSNPPPARRNAAVPGRRRASAGSVPRSAGRNRGMSRSGNSSAKWKNPPPLPAGGSRSRWMRRWLGGALVSVVLACTALMAGWSPAPALICARPNAAGEVVSEPLAGAKRVRAAAARVRPSPIAPPGPQSKVPDGEEMASSESHSMSNRHDPSSGSLPDLGDRRSVGEKPPVSAPAVDRTDPGRVQAQNEILRLETADFSIRVERPASSGLRDDPDSAVRPASRLDASPTGDPLTHIVVRGDTLWAISQRYLGSPLRYAELAENSRIPDPNLIFPGDVIRFVRKR